MGKRHGNREGASKDLDILGSRSCLPRLGVLMARFESPHLPICTWTGRYMERVNPELPFLLKDS